MDCYLFMHVSEIIERREHLTSDGLRKIVAIKASMNRGLSDKLKLAFADVVPVERPRVELPKTIDPNWLAGFTDGEGSFMIIIRASKTHSVGFQVQLGFQLSQHIRDENLMKSFISLFQCGTIHKKRDVIDFRVYKLSDITEKIMPFFSKHRIRGVKALDFADWCKVAEMIKEKKTFDKRRTWANTKDQSWNEQRKIKIKNIK